jgi:hypothetical protein
MVGANFSNVATGFKNVSAFATTGNDIAVLYGTTGNDTYRAYYGYAEMKGGGNLYKATGFADTTGLGQGGADKAYLYDTTGNDTYSAYSQYVQMAGSGYVNKAQYFGKTFAYASQGYDIAMLDNSNAADVYRNYTNRATMSGWGYVNSVYGFDSAQTQAAWNSTALRSLNVIDEAVSDRANNARTALEADSRVASAVSDRIGRATTVLSDRTSNVIARVTVPGTTEKLSWDECFERALNKGNIDRGDDVGKFADDTEDADAIDALFELNKDGWKFLSGLTVC